MAHGTGDGTRLTATIDTDTLRELCGYMPGGTEMDKLGQVWLVKANTLSDTSRWGIWYQLILRADKDDTDEFYSFMYETPAAGSKSDFWGDQDADLSTLYQVFPKTVTVTVYE